MIPRRTNVGQFNPDKYDIQAAQRWLVRHFGSDWYKKLTEEQIESIDIKNADSHLVTLLGTHVQEIWSLMPHDSTRLNLFKMRRYGFRAIQQDEHYKTVGEAERLNVMWKALIYKLRSE